jgi:hypothetical protein
MARNERIRQRLEEEQFYLFLMEEALEFQEECNRFGQTENVNRQEIEAEHECIFDALLSAFWNGRVALEKQNEFLRNRIMLSKVHEWSRNQILRDELAGRERVARLWHQAEELTNRKSICDKSNLLLDELDQRHQARQRCWESHLVGRLGLMVDEILQREQRQRNGLMDRQAVEIQTLIHQYSQATEAQKCRVAESYTRYGVYLQWLVGLEVIRRAFLYSVAGQTLSDSSTKCQQQANQMLQGKQLAVAVSALGARTMQGRLLIQLEWISGLELMGRSYLMGCHSLQLTRWLDQFRLDVARLEKARQLKTQLATTLVDECLGRFKIQRLELEGCETVVRTATISGQEDLERTGLALARQRESTFLKSTLSLTDAITDLTEEERRQRRTIEMNGIETLESLMRSRIQGHYAVLANDREKMFKHLHRKILARQIAAANMDSLLRLEWKNRLNIELAWIQQLEGLVRETTQRSYAIWVGHVPVPPKKAASQSPSPSKGDGKKPAPPFLGFSILSQTAGPLYIDGYYIGGPANVEGMRIGDEVVAIGGMSVKNQADVRKAVSTKAVIGSLLEVKYKREGIPQVQTALLRVLTTDASYQGSPYWFDLSKSKKITEEAKAK